MQYLLYSELIAPVAEAFSSKVMAIGLFLVAVGYLRTGFARRMAWASSDFAKCIILLAAVLLFSLYVLLSYQTFDPVPQASPAGEAVSLLVKLKILLFAPLEMLLAGIEATLFLILGVDAVSSIDEAEEAPSVSRKVMRLYVATALWHGIVVVWWLLWIGSDHFSPTSLCQQVVFGSLHGVAAIIWGHFRHTSPKTVQSRNEWFAVATYAVIITIVYCTRLVYYIDKAATVP